MCGECLGNGYTYRNGKRVKCAPCKGEGVITEEITIDEGQPESEGAK